MKNSPTLLVLKEKYGDRYFLYNNEAERNIISFHILKERWAQYEWEENLKNFQDSIKINEEKIIEIEKVITEISASDLKIGLSENIQNIKIGIKSMKRSLDSLMQIKTVLEKEYFSEAWKALVSREKFEYEGFSMEEVKTVETIKEE